MNSSTTGLHAHHLNKKIIIKSIITLFLIFSCLTLFLDRTSLAVSSGLNYNSYFFGLPLYNNFLYSSNSSKSAKTTKEVQSFENNLKAPFYQSFLFPYNISSFHSRSNPYAYYYLYCMFMYYYYLLHLTMSVYYLLSIYPM